MSEQTEPGHVLQEQTGPPQFGFNDPIPIVLRRGGIPGEGDDTYSIKLAGIELGMHLAAGGVSIAFDNPDIYPGQPTVTLTFAPDAVEVDIDAAVVALAKQRRRQQSPIRRFFFGA